LHLNLPFELVLAQSARHLDDFSDGRIATDRYCDVLGAGAGTLDRTLDGIANGTGIDDRLLVNRVRRRRLCGVRLHTVLTTTHAELDQLHRGGGDVQTDERSGFGG
jgi:hypothetical protein